MARVEMVDEEEFNRVMVRAAKLQPQCSAAVDAAAALVYGEAVKEATRHHVTGNFARSIQIQKYGKAAGKKIIATDKNAQSIEYGHFLGKREQPGQNDEEKPEETLNKGPLKKEDKAGKAGVDKEKTDGLRVWVNGTHIMRTAAIKAGGVPGKEIAAAVKA